VGKSTLFNRITRSKDAIVDDFPGVTRDRNYSDAEWDGVEFTLVDTGGFLDSDGNDFTRQIRLQLYQAVEDSDVIILVLDGKAGISPFDKDLVKLLREIKKPGFFVVNKIDGIEREADQYDFFQLGLEKLFSLSAEHGYGVSDFLDELVKALPRIESRDTGSEAEELINIAVVGRPNVGKSSLINRILGQDRLVVSEIPGTTRDAIDSLCRINAQSYRLIDTAGIRRKSKVSKKLEKFSVIKALRSLERCDIALIVLDAAEGITEQDVTIAGYAYERGRACIFLLNKWDLVEKDGKTAAAYYQELKRGAKFLGFAPALTISAKTGLRVVKVFNLVDELFKQYITRIGTGQLNKIIQEAVQKTEPPLHRGRRIKFYYTTQIATRPPVFVSFVNYPKAVHFSYRRFLLNRIRAATGLDKIPLKVSFRERKRRSNKG
jgi:GTP-binding protein